MLISLKTQAAVACALSILVASAIPAVEYFYVYQYDHLGLGPNAWTHWGIILLTCLLGLIGHLSAASFPLALHAALGGMLGAALGGYDTALFLSLDLRCTLQPLAYAGCAACACAQAGACTSSELAGDAGCEACPVYPTSVCTPIGRQYNYYLLAFTGMTAVVALAVPVTYSLLVLARREGRRSGAAARVATLRFAVEQQTALVASGDRPSVTPSSLAGWVAELQAAEADPVAWAVAERCVQALADRGYTMALPEAGGGQGGKKALRPEEEEIQAEAAAQREGSRSVGHAGGGAAPSAPSPPDAAMSAAELGLRSGGGKRPKRQQVAAEDAADKW